MDEQADYPSIHPATLPDTEVETREGAAYNRHMTLSPVRRLVVGYAVLWALLEVAVYLPGNFTSTFWGTVGRLAVGALNRLGALARLAVRLRLRSSAPHRCLGSSGRVRRPSSGRKLGSRLPFA